MNGVRFLAGLLVVGACATELPPPRRTPYVPDRRDYVTFREAYPEILEPNYLPYMAHWARAPDGLEDVLVFCRWAPEAFPLRVHIEPPVIPPDADEFHVRHPFEYVDAVETALETWEHALEGFVAFERAESPADAQLQVALLGEVAPETQDVRILGSAKMGGACRLRQWDTDTGRAVVEFGASDLRVYVIDDSGPLGPDQVERIALHELGHALGMLGHSPIAGDLMFQVARDRLVVDGVSEQDANSFVSLYQIPNGTVFTRISPDGAPERALPSATAGPPIMALAPHVDARFGFEIRPPAGWMRMSSPRGFLAIDGVTWDYDATFQVIVRNYPTVASYLARHGATHVGEGKILDNRPLRIRGRPAVRIRVQGRGGDFIEELTFVETGDGRVFVAIADCPSELWSAYEPWFRAIFDTLEIWPPEGQNPAGARRIR